MPSLPYIYSRAVACATLFAAAGFAAAEIDYEVSVRTTAEGTHALHVSMLVPTDGGGLALQSPRWGPGSYDYSDYGKAITVLSAVDGKGAKLAFEHPDFSTWVVSAPKGVVKVDYELPIGVTNDTAHYGGPRTYLYVVNRTQEKAGLKFSLPDGWKIRMGLDPTNAAGTEFTAPTYDVLADTPVTMGHFLEDTYTSHGKPHYIVMYGSGAAGIDRKMLGKICKFTSDAEGTFFGEVPYKRYVWHFNVSMGARDGGSGLEHLNGTEISLGTGVGTGAQSVITHEFFHLWNVKRIRSKVLGPFNYTVLPKTGGLWWLEGVTDYYAIMLPSRYGWWDQAQTEKFLARNIQQTEGNEGRMRISAYDSSYRVNEANNGRGNSNGLYVSYYNTGWICGLMLDLEIRLHSKGKYSLDDVELALWNECKNNQPGFEEGEIRNLVVKFGGDELGPLFDKWVMSPGALPVEDELAKIGLKYGMADTTVATFPVRTTASVADHGLRIENDDEGPVEVITEINGQALPTDNQFRLQGVVPRLISGMKPGDKVSITVVTTYSTGKTKTEKRDVQLGSATRRVGLVTEIPGATPEQLALRKAWLAPRPGTKPVSATILAPSN